MDTGPEDGETSEAAVEGGGGKWKETAASLSCLSLAKRGLCAEEGLPKVPTRASGGISRVGETQLRLAAVLTPGCRENVP